MFPANPPLTEEEERVGSGMKVRQVEPLDHVGVHAG